MPLSVKGAALRYALQGFPVVPLNGKVPLTPHGYKDGSTDPDQIHRWWREHPEAWVGVVVGPASGLCVLDVDPRSGGDESLKHLTEEHGPLPETPAVSTAGGGMHYYFRYNEMAARSTIAPGLELKARDGYVVAPTSRNGATGAAYTWVTGKGVALAELPPWLVGQRGIIARDPSALNEGPIPARMRNATLTSLAGTLRKGGETEEGLRTILLAENQARCQPPLPDHEVEGIARSVARYPATSMGSPRNVQPAWPDPLEQAAYHGLAGEFVHLIEEHTESDPVALLVQFLVGFGNLVGRSPYFAVEADRHHANEFVVLVGESSRGRKGTAWGNALRPLRAVDPGWADLRQQGGLSSGEGLIWAARDSIEGRSPIRNKGHIVGYEDVQEDPGITDKRLLVFEPEFASTLRVMGRDGSTLSSTVRQSWDTGDLRVMTKKSPAKASGAHVSIIGHITRDELLRYLDRTEAANGFINRFLIVCVRRARILPEGGMLNALEFGPLFGQVRHAVERSRARTELHRDAGARDLWFEIYGELSEGRPGLLGAVISRAEAHVVRLSLLYALLDGAEQIGRPHLEAALALWRYAEASARYIFGDALGDPVADELLATLRARPEGLTRTEISAHFGRHRRAEEIGRALAALAERGLVRAKREETAGRVAERWFAARGAKEAKEAKEGPEPETVSSHSSLSSQSAEETESDPTPVPSLDSLLSQSAGETDAPPTSGVQPSVGAEPPEEGTWVA